MPYSVIGNPRNQCSLVARFKREASFEDDLPAPALVIPEPYPGDVAVLLFSGGTTGLPKAVEHTHERLVIAVRCMEYNWPTPSGGEVWLPIAPVTHIYGFLQ